MGCDGESDVKLCAVESKMEWKTVTLEVDSETWRMVQRIAARRRTSVSALIGQALEDLCEQADAYGAARERHLRQLEQGLDLGSGGRITLRREAIHERAAHE